jgi:hypothetical protein
MSMPVLNQTELPVHIVTSILPLRLPGREVGGEGAP